MEEVILDVLDTEQPDNVKELVLLVQKKVDAPADEIQKHITNLNKKGLIALDDPAGRQPLFKFAFQKQSLWFWIILAISGLAFASVMFIPETQSALSYVRYSLGFILVAFLPGYCLTETLFPRKHSLDLIERITFSIGLSFASTALVGLFLSFTPLGLKLATALPALGGLVVALAVFALFRKYQKQ